MVRRDVPEYIRSDNGPEFTAKEGKRVDREDRSQDSLHRAREPVGERVQRELQRQAQRRAAEQGDLLFTEGGADTDGTVEAGVQHAPATQPHSDTGRRRLRRS